MRGRQDDIHLMERVTRMKGEGSKAIPNLWKVRVSIVLSYEFRVQCEDLRSECFIWHLCIFI